MHEHTCSTITDVQRGTGCPQGSCVQSMPPRANLELLWSQCVCGRETRQVGGGGGSPISGSACVPGLIDFSGSLSKDPVMFLKGINGVGGVLTFSPPPSFFSHRTSTMCVSHVCTAWDIVGQFCV